MFTDIDYLVQAERHKDYIAYAERRRRRDALLPAKALNPVLRRLFARAQRMTSAWNREAKPTGVPLQQGGI